MAKRKEKSKLVKKNTDAEEIIDRMMNGSDLIRKNKNKLLKPYKRKLRDGNASKSYKNKLGRHMEMSKDDEVGE